MSIESSEYTVYIGSYASEANGGVHIVKLDRSTGAMRLESTVAGFANPSFLTIHPNGRWLYAVNEVDAIDGHSGGALTACSIDATTGGLRHLGRQSTLSQGPCHVSIDASGRFALVANYRGGGVTVLPILADGSLGPATDYKQHSGSSVDPKRQEGPHAHSVLPAPTGQLIFVADLGLDKVLAYLLDRGAGKLLPLTQYIQTQPGAGPRHFTFSSDGGILYIFNELDSTINTYQYDAGTAVSRLLGSVSALPAGFTGVSFGADIHLHSNGRLLYATNRGHDSFVIIRIDKGTGALAYVGHVSTQGSWPRHFTLAPNANLLLVANQKSDNVVSFWIDEESGMLTPTGHSLQVSAPTCVQIRPA